MNQRPILKQGYGGTTNSGSYNFSNNSGNVLAGFDDDETEANSNNFNTNSLTKQFSNTEFGFKNSSDSNYFRGVVPPSKDDKLPSNNSNTSFSKSSEINQSTSINTSNPIDMGKFIGDQLDPTKQHINVNDIICPDGHGGDNLRSSMHWREFNLAPPLMKGLAELNFRNPSGIQGRALPETLLKRRHIIAQSQNGTGKTGTYLITVLSVIDLQQPDCQALILVHTHELALQVVEVARKMGKYLSGYRVACAIPSSSDIAVGSLQAQVVVGTPGTVSRIALNPNNNLIDLTKLKLFVLDEADQLMENSSFFNVVKRLRTNCRPECQILFFSATFEKDIRDYAHELINSKDVKEILLSVQELALRNVRQFQLVTHGFQEKFQALLLTYRVQVVTACLVFCKTRKEAHHLSELLEKEGHSVGVLSGQMDQQDREIMIERFRKSEIRVLISTNVISRGLDIAHLNLVVNWDQPMIRNEQTQELKPDFETYLHRVGRSGRFGRFGLALNFIDGPADENNIMSIENYFGIEIPLINFKNRDDMDRVVDPTSKSDTFIT